MLSQAIQTDKILRRFGTRAAVNEISFSVEMGEVFGLLGPNGAGKTTLVRLLNGVLESSGGSARVLGFDPLTQGDQLRQQTGVLTETPSLYEGLSARDNLRFFGTLYDVPEAELNQRVNEALQQFGLTDRADSRAAGFSKGMKQRLALARTLVHHPQLLFFDEPTAALDPEAAQHVTELIEQLSHKDGRTVFLCTHNLDEAGRLCDRVGIIKEGRLLAVGTPAQLAGDLWKDIWVDIVLAVEPDEGGFMYRVKNIPGVVDAALNGKALAIQVSAENAIPDAVAGVISSGGHIMRVNPREHTLQEIYFRLQQEAHP
jgi:ABC-2 type transport system ATP-binding protein